MAYQYQVHGTYDEANGNAVSRTHSSLLQLAVVLLRTGFSVGGVIGGGQPRGQSAVSSSWLTVHTRLLTQLLSYLHPS